MRLEGGVAYLTADEMAIADRDASEVFGISTANLMEKAGLATATLAQRMLGGVSGERRVVCLVGKGNNGGDGLVAARHLADWGVEGKVVLGAERAELRDLPAQQLRAAHEKGIEVLTLDEGMTGAKLIIDALLGYSSWGNPKEPVATLIRSANDSGVPVLAVDLPSGLDASSGEPGDPCIRAASTVTFGFPKSGFLNPRAAPYLGHLYLADIGAPVEIYRKHGMYGKPFTPGETLLELKVPEQGSTLFKDVG
jgi:NAD(P)H-hydrate epimerase